MENLVAKEGWSALKGTLEYLIKLALGISGVKGAIVGYILLTVFTQMVEMISKHTGFKEWVTSLIKEKVCRKIAESEAFKGEVELFQTHKEKLLRFLRNAVEAVQQTE